MASCTCGHRVHPIPARVRLPCAQASPKDSCLPQLQQTAVALIIQVKTADQEPEDTRVNARGSTSFNSEYQELKGRNDPEMIQVQSQEKGFDITYVLLS